MREHREHDRTALRGLAPCALVMLSLLGCGGEEAPQPDVEARIDARLEELRADERAMRAALSPLPAITGPCEVPSNVAGPAILGASADVPSARLEAFTEGTSELRDRAATITANGADRWLERYGGDEWMRYELVIVATAHVAPSLSQMSYEPGSVDGRAVLWDHVADGVLCARDVRVRPPGEEAVHVAAGSDGDAVESRGGALRTLERQLNEAALAQSLEAMRREPEAAAPDPEPP